MKTKKIIFVCIVLLFLSGVIITSASALKTRAADRPWSVDLFDGDESGVRNLSTTFVDDKSLPLLIYSRANPIYRVHMAHPATEATEHNCGPGGNWTCAILNPSNYLYEGVLSNIATYTGGNNFSIAYAFQTENKIYISVFRQQFNNDMTLGATELNVLINLYKFGGIHYELAGNPSLIIDELHYLIAVVVRNQDTNRSSLVFAYYNPGNSSPCKDGSDYQCDVVTTFTGTGSSPSLAEVDGTVGIAYYNPETADLMYAYPHTHSSSYPSNCGPGNPQTYRCITIYSSDEIGPDVQLAFGGSSSERAIAFTRDYLLGNFMYSAVYVGRSGNCGSDKNISGMTVQKWECTNLESLIYNPSPSFAIALDPDGYPVIAYDNALDDLAPISLYLTYPNERVGLPGTQWVQQKIDGAPTTTVETGAQASLALTGGGLGFISYIQKEDYENPTIKIALQDPFFVFLPIIAR